MTITPKTVGIRYDSFYLSVIKRLTTIMPAASQSIRGMKSKGVKKKKKKGFDRDKGAAGAAVMEEGRQMVWSRQG